MRELIKYQVVYYNLLVILLVNYAMITSNKGELYLQGTSNSRKTYRSIMYTWSASTIIMDNGDNYWFTTVTGL